MLKSWRHCSHFSGIVATGAYIWSSKMERRPLICNVLSILSKILINLDDDNCKVTALNSYTTVGEHGV